MLVSALGLPLAPPAARVRHWLASSCATAHFLAHEPRRQPPTSAASLASLHPHALCTPRSGGARGVFVARSRRGPRERVGVVDRANPIRVTPARGAPPAPPSSGRVTSLEASAGRAALRVDSAALCVPPRAALVPRSPQPASFQHSCRTRAASRMLP